MVDNADEETLPAAQSQLRDRENDKEKSFLYRISNFRTFSFFKKVVLVSCPKDQYVPFYSARIQVFFFVDGFEYAKITFCFYRPLPRLLLMVLTMD